MITNNLLESIKTRIDNISTEIRVLNKTDPENDQISVLKWKLALHKEAYKFNSWLYWRHMDNYPYEKTSTDLILSSYSKNDNKKY